MPALDLQGRRFGRLLVISRIDIPGSRNAMWSCKCDCGSVTTGAASNLGKTKFSCGCLAKETAANLLAGNTNTRTHGMAGKPEYQAWTKMKLRCHDPNNPKYYTYGARGISVCDEWRNSFESFYRHIGPRPSRKHSIGRIDNDGNYEPGNVRWETAIQQGRNATFNNPVTIDSVTLCVSEWCEVLGVSRFKPYEMTRGRGRKRNLPPECETVEEALLKLYQKANSQ